MIGHFVRRRLAEDAERVPAALPADGAAEPALFSIDAPDLDLAATRAASADLAAAEPGIVAVDDAGANAAGAGRASPRLAVVAEPLRLVLIDDETATRALAAWERLASMGGVPDLYSFEPLTALSNEPGVCLLHQTPDDPFDLHVLTAQGEFAGLGRAESGRLRLGALGDAALVRHVATDYVGCLAGGRPVFQMVTARGERGQAGYRRLLLPLRWRTARADVLVSLAWPPVSLPALVRRARPTFGRRGG